MRTTIESRTEDAVFLCLHSVTVFVMSLQTVLQIGCTFLFNLILMLSYLISPCLDDKEYSIKELLGTREMVQ